MKLTMDTVEHFASEATRAPKLYQDTVRMLVDRAPLQREAVSFDVTVQLTTLVIEDDGSEYMMELVKYCGIDTVNGPMDGSELAIEMEQKLGELLPEHIQIRPGKLEQ